MSNLTTLYIVRHGQTDWNAQHIIQGHTDTLLNKEGEKQAHELKNELNHVKFDKVFSSDLLRAKRTAEIVVLEKGLAVETTKVLRELNYGDFEGTISGDFFKKFDEWRALSEEERKKHEKYESYSKVETWDEASSRLITFLREVAVAYRGKTVLVTTHGGIMHNLLVHLGYASPKKIKKVKNTSYIKLEADGVDFFVKDVKGVEIIN